MLQEQVRPTPRAIGVLGTVVRHFERAGSTIGSLLGVNDCLPTLCRPRDMLQVAAEQDGETRALPPPTAAPATVGVEKRYNSQRKSNVCLSER
jgi:hypothetical protein